MHIYPILEEKPMSKEIVEMLGAIQTKQDEKAQELVAKTTEIEAKNEEAMAELKSQYENQVTELKERIKTVEVQASAAGSTPTAQSKSLGQMVVVDKRFDEFKSGNINQATIEVKAPTGDVANADTFTYSQRLAGIVGLPQNQPTVYSFLPRGRATSNAIDYIKEISFTPNADEVAELGTLPQSTVEFAEAQTPVVTIGHFIRASDQMLADHTAAADLIDTRMASKTLTKLDQAIVAGTGTMKGLLDVSNHTVLTGTSGDGIYQSIRRAITELDATEFSASVIILNPRDVELLDLDALADGEFRASNPRAYNAPIAWGLPVIKSHHVPQGKFIVLDDSYVTVWERASVLVEIGYDSDDFTHNRKTIRANVRAALTVYNSGAVIYGDTETAIAGTAAKAKK